VKTKPHLVKAVRQSGRTLSAVGGVGLDGFHISGVASGWLGCGGGFRADDGCVTGRWVCDDRFYGLVNRSNR